MIKQFHKDYQDIADLGDMLDRIWHSENLYIMPTMHKHDILYLTIGFGSDYHLGFQIHCFGREYIHYIGSILARFKAVHTYNYKLLNRLLQAQFGLSLDAELGSDLMLAKYAEDERYTTQTIAPKIKTPTTSMDLFETFVEQSKAMKESNLYTQLFLPATDLFYKIENKGIKVDYNKVVQNNIGFAKKLDRLDSQIQKISAQYVKKKTNLNSADEVNILLKEIPKDEYSDVYALVKEYRSKASLLATNIKPLLDTSATMSTVHTHFKVTGSTTGRIHSAKPCIQNLKKDPDIRNQFVVRDESNMFYSFDYKQIDLCVLADISDDEWLQQTLKGGDSIHRIVSRDIWGEEWENDMAMSDRTKERQIAERKYTMSKGLTFGIIYGRGAKSLADEFGVSVEIAESWIKAWMNRYPKAWGFLQASQDCARKRTIVTTPFGRSRRPQRYRSIEEANMDALSFRNFAIQSCAHDITLSSMFEIDRQYPDTIVNFGMDSILIETKKDKDVVNSIISIMEETPLNEGFASIPFRVSAEQGKAWGSMKPIN